jgi:preprotein translocase subunit SecE
VADKDEVKPTEPSDAAEPVDVPDDVPTASADDADIAEPINEVDVADEDTDAAEGDQVADELNGDSDAKVLEPAGVGASAAAAKEAVARTGRAGRAPKSAPTTKRDQPVKRERTSPVKFVKQSVGELRKVVYPTGEQLIKYFVVVLVFVLFVIAYVSLLDLGFGAAIFKIFA